MVGSQSFLRCRDEKRYTAYIALLNDVLAEVTSEQKRIKAGYSSKWSLTQLIKVITPEISELLHYARMGKLYFKYGKKQRMLESTYLIVDSCDNLKDTELGKKILKLQHLYSRIK